MGRERRRGPVIGGRPSPGGPDGVVDLEPIEASPEPDEVRRAEGEAPVGETPAPVAEVRHAGEAPTIRRPSEVARAVARPGPAVAATVAPSPATPPARGPEAGGPGAPASGPDHGATAPQLRRFIKSRAYVPMHELRRRFGINGNDDDVVPIDVDRQRVYVGLPPREGRLLGELLRGGDIGVELSLDPIAPIVVGVYPLRPIPRS